MIDNVKYRNISSDPYNMIIIYVMNNRKNTYVCVSDNTNGVYIYVCVCLRLSQKQ